MRSLLAGSLALGIALAAAVTPSFAKEKMMATKCVAPDKMVMVDMKTKMYHGMTDKKSHMMMMKSGDKTMMTCKSKADKMGAKMMMNGKAMM